MTHLFPLSGHRTQSVRRQLGLTLTEMTVSISIVLVVVSIGLVAQKKAKEHSTLANCVSNLRSFGLAFNQYLALAQTLPDDLQPLTVGLADYGIGSEIVICPADRRKGATDSYSATYIRRRQADPDTVSVVNCARHAEGENASVLTLGGAVSVEKTIAITQTKAGATRKLLVGDSFDDGEISTNGACKLTVSNLNVASGILSNAAKPAQPALVGNFQHRGTDRLIVYLPFTSTGTFTAEASTGSILEVVSPQMVVEVDSGKATIIIQNLSGQLSTSVANYSGKVTVFRRDMDRKIALVENSVHDLLAPVGRLVGNVLRFLPAPTQGPQ